MFDVKTLENAIGKEIALVGDFGNFYVCSISTKENKITQPIKISKDLKTKEVFSPLQYSKEELAKCKIVYEKK